MESLEGDRLVIFVGAGASVEQPSGLPLFPELARDIADGSLSREGGEPLERFLGRLEGQGTPVHRRAAKILSRDGSTPNDLHRLIVELFESPQKVKIVTTNFDLHLESAAQERFKEAAVECEIYRASALPLGREFSGIVYLHGSLHPEPSRMVLTDRDFGRAYLTEGWAQRFLTDLFQSHDVLFVGYSHTDQIVSYLARGLPTESKRARAALTQKGETDRWKFLGIEPLEYPENEHGEVKRTLREWVRLRRLAPLEHEKEIREIVERPTELLTPHESDRLVWTITRKSEYRHFFFRQANNPEWLEWAGSAGLLEPIFDPTSEDTDTPSWFAGNALSERGDTAIAFLQQKAARKLTLISWSALAHSIWVSKRNKERKLTTEEYKRLVQWVSLLLLHAEPASNWQMLDYLVGDLGSESADLILLLLEALTEPRLAPTARYRLFEERPTLWRSEIRYPMAGNINGAREAWSKTILPNMERFAQPVLGLVQIQLERSYRLLRASGQARSRFDPQSYHRTTIENSDQLSHLDDTVDLLVDAGRDSLEWLLENKPDQGRLIIELWLTSEATLLRRLALHGAAGHSKFPPRQLAQFLLTDGRINEHQLHHEVFALLTAAYPSLGITWRKRLLGAKRRLLKEEYAEAKRVGKERAQERRAYRWFSFLAWLSRADPNCEIVQRELGEVRQQYPAFEERERPDLTHYTVDHGSGPVESLTTAEMIALEPSEVYSRYKQLVQADRFDIHEKVHAFQAVLQRGVQEDVDWSFGTGTYLFDRKRPSEREVQDLQRSLLLGWREADLKIDKWRRLVKLLRQAAPDRSVESYILDVLQERFESKGSDLDCQTIQETLVLALELHGRLREAAEETVDPTNPLQTAINHPCGTLALFAVSVWSRAVKLKCSDAEQLPELWGLLDALVDDAKYGKLHGLVVLVSQLHFALYAGRDWATTRLLPLLGEWKNDPPLAASLWAGFLDWARLSPITVASILPLLPQLFRHLEKLPERSRERVSQYVAIIAFRSQDAPIQERWFKDYLRYSSDNDRQHFGWQIRQILSELWEAKDNEEVETGDSFWARMLATYMDVRLEGDTIGGQEWSAVAPWCLYLDRSIPDFVERFVQGPEFSDPHTSVFHWLRKTEHIYRYPDDIADFVLHILKGQLRKTAWHFSDIAKVVGKLEMEDASESRIEAIKNRCLELGASSSLFGSDE